MALGRLRLLLRSARSTRAVPAGVLAVLLALAAGPGVASAHGVPSTRFEAPLPLSLVLAGAGATVALTAAWMGVARRRPRPPRDGRHLATVSLRTAGAIRTVAGMAFAALVVAALVHGLLGPRTASNNVATVFVWPLWIHGLALLAVIVGSLWPTLSPWETLYDGLVRLEGREVALLGSTRRSLERAGQWVAVVGFVAVVGILEQLTIVPRSPELTVGVLAAYGLVMLVGSLLAGRTWLRSADPLGVLYRLFGRVAPVALRRRESGATAVTLRPPWRGCREPVGSVALVAFAVAAVYTVSFDGFANTEAYRSVLFPAQDLLGVGPATGALLYVAGLVGFLATFALVAWLVERIGSDASAGDWVGATRWFAPTVLPIAAAYEVAHNYPWVLQNLGTLLELLASPVAPGVGPVDLVTWLPVPVYWASQVGLIVLGHVVAVVAAHRVALLRYDSPRTALLAHLPLVALMVGYTVLSLWIVSRPLLAA